VSKKYIREGQVVYVRCVVSKRMTKDEFGDWEVVPITKTQTPVQPVSYLYVRNEAVLTQDEIRNT